MVVIMLARLIYGTSLLSDILISAAITLETGRVARVRVAQARV